MYILFKMSSSELESVLSSILLLESQAVVQDSSKLYGFLENLYGLLEIVSGDELNRHPPWRALEASLNCKGVLFGSGFHNFYSIIYLKCLTMVPTYIVRTAVAGLLGIIAGKGSISSRECAIVVIGHIAKEWGPEMGSSSNDIVTTLAKVIRSYDMTISMRSLNSDMNLRGTIYTTLSHVANHCSEKVGLLHGELVKLASKWVAQDKSADVRISIAVLIESIANNSSGFQTITLETLLAVANKGLLDEVGEVSVAYSKAIAACYCVQIQRFISDEESARAELARGGANPSASASATPSSPVSSKVSSMAFPWKRKLVEKYDYQSLFAYALYQIPKSTGTARTANIFILQYLVQGSLATFKVGELEWSIQQIIDIFNDPIIQSMDEEQMTLFKCRISHVFRDGIFANIGESLHLLCANTLAAIMNRTTPITNVELQFTMSELSHLIYILSESAISLVEEVEVSALTFLRNSDFNIRTCAVYLLLSVASATPIIAARFFRDALSNAKGQAKMLASFDGIAGSEGSKVAGSRSQTGKFNEIQQRMYLFHGQVLLISLFMKNLNELPTGLPGDAIIDAMEFGLSLMANNVTSVPLAVRPIACSVMRAGSLIVSSALSIGYTTVHTRIPSLLGTVKFLLTLVDPSAETSAADDMPELMCIESALVIIIAAMVLPRSIAVC